MPQTDTVDKVLCIVGRLMAIAPLVPRLIADVAAIAAQLKGHPDPVVRACSEALHDPDKIKAANPHI